MKHYFIINPIAGHSDSTNLIQSKISETFLNLEDETFIYITNGVNDATIYVKKICELYKNCNDEIVFYICGGDGTCYEVVNSLVGYSNVYFTIIPIGSCNDFLKNFPGADFSNLSKLVHGKILPIDVLKINDRYSLNVINIGYDAKVNRDCVLNRDKYKTVKQSYNAAIIKNILRPLGDDVTIFADNHEIFKGKTLLIALANGAFYGGGYKCAPKASCDDGLLDCVIVRKVLILTFARLIKYYKQGLHLDMERFNNIITFKKAKKITIVSKNVLSVCIDGENFEMNEVNIEVHKHALKFLIPNDYEYYMKVNNDELKMLK